MKPVWMAFAAVTFGALLAPAHAVPPTATPSPGYDARLQESRGGAATSTYTPSPRPPKRKTRKPPSQ